MNRIKISDRLTVASQPELADFPSIAAEGFKGVINVRPDGEDDVQPGDANERRAAASSGLGYEFVPVTGQSITEADVRAFQKAMDAADGPVFAHCKSGTRALTLHAIGEVLDGRMAAADVGSFGAGFGLDLTGASRWLERFLTRQPVVKGFHDSRTGSVQYVVVDPETRHCAIIDPVLDFDEKPGGTATTHADEILDFVNGEGLQVEWVLDTHPHADHLSAASYLKQKTGAPTAIGSKVAEAQELWSGIYNLPELAAGGPYWDRLLDDGDIFSVGGIEGRAILTTGHTLASLTYVIGDAAFVHDTLFMPDSGTARADFPGGDAGELWRSIERILSLPDDTRIFTGHDYQPSGRPAKCESTVAEQRRSNIQVAGKSREEFVAMRNGRDGGLPMPKLILHALQVNLRGGRLPDPELDGKRYLKFPLNALKEAAW
ncbi:bifunctional sulfur transferase/dioxygenase Blh [Acetobacteraceae bacterium KSS8]|uniref:Bifunctional sulfur transferase/dioxygenase Blh n=1 Tax=Endosaccharibacter trunci TaxID=2812733 RepID=A0ABT1W8Q5_9PROT|nr:bifunctional sulfur transferase/dioxygenase Blh [Acetobacteraceae bacterium KSS8]